ncbi:MAG: diguanylate cyclase [bacterium]|nr:diguanylate cyclase [bacterium]
MDSQILPLHPAIIESATLAQLERAVYRIGDSLLAGQTAAGPGSLGENLILVLESAPPPSAWVAHVTTVHKGRCFRPFALAPALGAVAARGREPVLLPGAPVEHLETAAHASLSLDASLETTVAVPVRAQGGTLGLWLLGLRKTLDALPDSLRRDLAVAADSLGLALGRAIRFELLGLENAQNQYLNEAMARAATTAEKSAMLSEFLAILTRYFGFTRVLIAFVNEEAQVLRSELHTGFDTTFQPFTISLGDTGNFFIAAILASEAVIYDARRTGFPANFPQLDRIDRLERAAVFPLRVGSAPLGLIYADQLVLDGTPYFQSVFQGFARLASVAVENLIQRTSAERRAETDALTGLNNRAYLDRILEIEIPRVKRYNHPISLLMIDLCDFKNINDTYGHQFGDYILRETAALIQANVRRPDVAVRYGGDEFVVLMVNTTYEQAERVRDRIERAFVERNRLQTDERMVINISLGLRAADAHSIEGLLYDADMAMYAHKAEQLRAQLLKALIVGNIEKIEKANRVVGSLCNMLYKKEPYYCDHSRRVAHLALVVARRIGLPAHELVILALAALLHDVGKVSIPTEILQKTDPLTESEREAMRHHPALGEEFFEGIEHLEPIRPIIRSHHERFDGDLTGRHPGYPDGLSGQRIPLGARILHLAECADGMLSGRPYRTSIPAATVTHVLRQEAGKSFEPRLVEVLLADQDWYRGLGNADAIENLLSIERQCPEVT